VTDASCIDQDVDNKTPHYKLKVLRREVTEELIGKTSEKSKKINHEGYCPICTLHCTCSKCLRRLDAIQDYVASLCWAEHASSATSSDITESEVEKIATRVVASLDLLCFADGNERIPMFKKTPVFTAASILAASQEPATNDTNIKTKRRRSEENHSKSELTNEVAARRNSNSGKITQSTKQQKRRRGGDSPRRRSRIDQSILITVLFVTMTVKEPVKLFSAVMNVRAPFMKNVYLHRPGTAIGYATSVKKMRYPKI